MMWHMFVIKRFSAAAQLMEKVSGWGVFSPETLSSMSSVVLIVTRKLAERISCCAASFFSPSVNFEC